MLFSDTTFIGIDIPGFKRPLTYCALDADLDLLALGHGSEDDILAFVNGQEKSFVAINNPRRPNIGIMADEGLRAGLRPQPKPGRWEGWRLAEYELRQRRIMVTRTPKRPENAPPWMRLGFSLFRQLEEWGFQQFTSVFTADAGDSIRVSVETYPHAVFTTLLERIPFSRSSLEGRIQRQLVLYLHDVGVPDPMDVFEEITRYRLLRGELSLETLLEPTQLDALAAAFTAHAASRGNASLLGHPDEGQLAVPVTELLARYS